MRKLFILFAVLMFPLTSFAGGNGVTAYVPEGGELKKAVVICPGGSYFWLDKKTEGKNVAEWLCSKGIAAFVLDYKVAGGFNFITDMRFLYGGRCFPGALDDLRRAIREIRAEAVKYGVDPDGIGVMGFSAGGHLAMLSAEVDDCPEGGISSKPDFVVSVYPVVTMSDERYVHRRSRRGFMGVKSGNKALRDSFSLEKNVPEGCCPVFLVNCCDDSVVDWHNSVLLDEALTDKGISHEYLCFPSGGHGFGLMPTITGTGTPDWGGAFLKWLNNYL